MKLLKSNLFSFVALSLLFLVACSSKNYKPASINEKNIPVETIHGAELLLQVLIKKYICCSEQ